MVVVAKTPTVRIGNRIKDELTRVFAPRILANAVAVETIIHPPQEQSSAILGSIRQCNRFVLADPSHDEFIDFVKGHPFERLILRPVDKHITMDELTQVTDSINFELACFEGGAIPASVNRDSPYMQFAWTRDMANKARGMIEAGCYEEAKKVVYCLAKFYNQRDIRSQLTAYHWYDHGQDHQPRDNYRTGKGGYAPIRGEIDDNGHMVRSNKPWGHNQIDAIGAWLHVTFYLANTLANPENPSHDPNLLKNLDEYLNREVNDENRIDSIFSVAFKSLNRIRCWDNFDLGPWEDIYAQKRASSVGITLCAAQEAKKYLEPRGWNTLSIHGPEHFRGEIENLITNCRRTVDERIPKDGGEAAECDQYPSDSALTFLLYPYNPGLDEAQELAILKTLYNHRIGPVGFTRRDEDNYVGRDYPYNVESEGIYSNRFVPDYKAAEWTIFDPLLAAFFFKKFSDKATRQRTLDKDSFSLAQFHLRRSIAQITKEPDVFVKRSYIKDPAEFNNPMDCIKQQIVRVNPFVLPEAYWFDSFHVDPLTERVGRWRPNENSPLLWAEANFALMVKEAIVATSIYENVRKRALAA